jgi:hypothetical protein
MVLADEIDAEAASRALPLDVLYKDAERLAQTYVLCSSQVVKSSASWRHTSPQNDKSPA